MNMYLIYKSLHLIALISWMAAIFYLPRLYVYHVGAKLGSEMDETFKVMEVRLLRIIMNPAMILTYLFGALLVNELGFSNIGKWFHAKLLFVIILTAFHGYLAYVRKLFVKGCNKNSAFFYRLLNEVPTILMVLIVFLAVMKPF
jgi:protoporphyrinogen IX oxidase